jgi:hypothetical protein
MMRRYIREAIPWLLIAATLVVAGVVYAPGLAGGFIYDDRSFIVGNAAVHVTDTDLRSWIAAAFSFPGGLHQGRWFGMLTFAANYYFGQLDPYGFKVVNVAIHLVNGFLVFLLLRRLFELFQETSGSRTFDRSLAAAAIAGLWLVLPINLTAVLYVAQRLESLSTTFVFLGLAWYLRARLRIWRGTGGTWGLWLSLLVCSGIGFLIKESAVLLPLYAACIEFAITRWRDRDGQVNRGLGTLYVALLGVPLVIGLCWLGSWMFGAESYARPFGTWQRLLSEARVLIHYIHWALVPDLDSLTLYHDDIAPSRGLMDPPSTILALAGLIALAGATIWQRRRRPLFTLGVALFLCGHALTATVIPLLLAFEHRNYFSSLGLLLACASLFALEGPLKQARLRVAAAVALFGFYAFTTWMRAQEWSDPFRLAMSEAGKRPASPSAQYELARAMIATGTLNGRPLRDDAFVVLEDNRNLPGASTLYEASLIVLSADAQLPADPAWWNSIVDKLRKRPPSIEDAGALQYLSTCFVQRQCTEDLSSLEKAYAQAMSYPHASAYLLSSHGEFAWHLQGDFALAEREFRAAIAVSPRDMQPRLHLIDLLISTRKLSDAKAEVDAIRNVNTFGMFDKLIARLDNILRSRPPDSPAS